MTALQMLAEQLVCKKKLMPTTFWTCWFHLDRIFPSFRDLHPCYA